MTMQQNNGQVQMPKALEEAYKTLNSAGLGVVICENASACSNPAEYEWRYMGKREMLVPYNCDIAKLDRPAEFVEAKLPDREAIRWEKHRVWIMEGMLRRGESNVMTKRRFYLDEDSWLILLGEGYDANGTMLKSFVLYHKPTPLGGRNGRWYPI